MSNWAHHVLQLEKQLSKDQDSGREYLLSNLASRLQAIAKLRKADNIFLYGSAFLQKPHISQWTSLVQEDIAVITNSLSDMHKNKTSENKLIIVLHAPGGDSHATNSIVDYLQNKFDYIEVIVPCMTMSAGTMISLSSDCVILGKQSQLGPIEPQVILNNEFIAASDVIKTFYRAKKEISTNPNLSFFWQPILRNVTPELIDRCKEELNLSEEVLQRSLIERGLIIMDSDNSNKNKLAEKLMEYLNVNYKAKNSKNRKIRMCSQNIRIDDLKNICSPNGLNLKALEDSQELQDEVMSAYHLMTILFENFPITKIIHSPHKEVWAEENYN